MLAKLSLGTAVMLLCVCGAARAADVADVAVRITDQNGDPAVNAVIVLSSDMSAAGQPLPGQLETHRLVDQQDETFVPHVTVIPRNGEVSFTNTDAPLHQVYSFSPTKQFELTLEPGETSSGIAFDKAGVAAIGCNINDHMIAYIFVTDSPWTVITDDTGQADIPNVPAGTYTAEIWHPRIPPAIETPSDQLVVGDAGARFQASIRLLPERGEHRSHGGRY